MQRQQANWHQNIGYYSLDVETFFDSTNTEILDFKALISKVNYLDDVETFPVIEHGYCHSRELHIQDQPPYEPSRLNRVKNFINERTKIPVIRSRKSKMLPSINTNVFTHKLCSAEKRSMLRYDLSDEDVELDLAKIGLRDLHSTALLTDQQSHISQQVIITAYGFTWVKASIN